MLNKKFKQALKIIHKKLKENNIKWALIGSVNICLQGIDVKPNDLDIVVELKDLEKVKEIFSDYNPPNINELKPLSKLDTKKSELKFEIDKIEIQIIGEAEKRLYVKDLLNNKLVKIKIGNAKIPCFSLKTEAETYLELNRINRVKLIKEFLDSQKI